MKKILILSANPINTKNLRLDEEVREIQAAWERALNREKFELINKGAVRIDELRRTLLDHKPQIVHFSGHGTGTDGLVLENNSGSAQIVSTQSLSRFFELSKDQVECVLLNACYSETQAEAIFQHIDCVIGMGQSIPDNSAILFSKGFYDAIFGGRNYADAFKFGCNNIDLNNLSEFHTPTIKIRHRDFSPEDSITTQPYIPLFFIGTVVFGLIISLLGLFRLVLNDYGLITRTLLGFGLITFWLCCAYIYYPSSRIAGFNINFFRRFKQYKKLRRLALAGMVILPLLGITGFYRLQLPTKNIIVLVADFETSAEQKNYGVTKRIFNKLDNAFLESPDVKVQRLNKIISNRQDARSEGESHKARIVIWGDYDVTSTNTQLNPHFEVLQTPKYLPKIGSLEQTASISELNNFKLQLRLSKQMTYLTYLTVGLIHYTVSDWEQAIIYFSKALEQGNDSNKALNQKIAYNYRGNSYANKKDDDRAIADYNQAIKLDPNFALAYNNRGNSYANKKDDDRAVADFNQAIKLDPNFAYAYNNRGLSYANKKDDDRAIADYNQAIKLDPNYALAYNNRGNSYANKKDDDRAIADYNQAIKLDPNLAYAYNNRGNSYANKKDDDRAI
ncbi:tetratricopeptide repeat protein, partial [Scytonema tolypothrichoides VB-61278]